MTNGVGLSRARLPNLRYAAMSYRCGSYTPKYLVQGMVEYGINFATFEALSSDTLDALHASLRQGWGQGGEDQESDESDVSVEPLISCSFPQTVMQEIGKAASQSTEAQACADEAEDTRALSTLLARFSMKQADSSDSESDGDEQSQVQEVTTPRGRGPSATNAVKRRKRKSMNSASGRAKAWRTTEQGDPQQTAEGNPEINQN